MGGRQRRSLCLWYGKNERVYVSEGQWRASQELEAPRLAGERHSYYTGTGMLPGCAASAQDKQPWTTYIPCRTGGARGRMRVEGSAIKRTGRTCAPTGGRGRFWSSGRERSGGGGQVLGRWNAQVLFVFSIGTSSRAGGMASPVLGGDSAVLVVGAVGSWSLGCVCGGRRVQE
jgi:hypothetical protein